MINHISDKVSLSNGVEMPWLGLGVHKSKEGPEVENAVLAALEAGYRSIDTATLYANETGVGKAIRQSGITREELFITTKIWNTDQGYESTFRAVETSLNKLQTEYIDLYLIHCPIGEKTVETWKAMEELYAQGKLKAIGVSNFLIHHLQVLISRTTVKPMVNQYEFHPQLAQPALLEYCRKHSIQPEAWRPIMQGRVNNVPFVKRNFSKIRENTGAACLKMGLTKRGCYYPEIGTCRTNSVECRYFDFEIEEEDMKRIDSLDKNYRLGDDPNDLESLFLKYGNP